MPFWSRDRTRTTGRPTSSNGASSFHLHWQLRGAPMLTEVRATLEVLVPPSVPVLYFWALQTGFSGGGAGHTGLQWFPKGRGVGVVNWGGYRDGGGELDGSVSPLPAVDGNVNSRYYDWAPYQPHELRVFRSPDGPGWRATVDGTLIRDLYGPGDFLTTPIVWSEVFAKCDDPSVTVRWSGLRAVTVEGEELEPEGLVTTYQSYRDGGCDNTNFEVDEVGVKQITSVERVTPPGAVLPLRT